MNPLSLLSQYAQFLKNGGLIPYFKRGLDYLTQSPQSNPPTTTPYPDGYTPPFSGGQCQVYYDITLRRYADAAGTYSNVISFAKMGAIGGFVIKPSINANQSNWFLISGSGTEEIGFAWINGSEPNKEPVIISLSKSGGGADDCGDLPNPNPIGIPNSGLSDSPAPNLLSGGEILLAGTGLGDDGSSALASGGGADFSDASTLAPTDLGGAIAKIASGLGKLLQLLALINDLIDLLKKLFSPTNKTSFSYGFGNLSKDGFIKLLSDPPDPNVEAVYLDIQITNVKVGLGKEFGEKSPNYYKYRPIGRVMFVSATYGIIETHDICYPRVSLPIPSIAYGFYYHFGLDGVNRANATGFYLKQEDNIE